MAFKFVNRARMTTATTGTGSITLGSAVAGFRSFAAWGIADGDTVRYLIEDGADWEIGTGTYTASGTTLARSVEESSNTDAAVSLTGSAEVMVIAAAVDIPASPIKAFTGAVTDDGTKSSGTYTPTPASGGPYKKIVNGGAFTLAPPTLANDEATTISLFVQNGGSSGAITTSGFTKVTGDAFTTTSTDEFLCRIEVIDIGGTEFSHLDVVAMQ